MTYAEFQQSHPEWPKQMQSLKGRRVWLMRGLVTVSGRSLRVGTVLVIAGVYRGYLHLDDLKGHIACRFVRPIEVGLKPKRKT